MPAGNGVTGATQILSEIDLHLDRSLIRHRVQMLIQLRHQSHRVLLRYPRSFVAVFVIFKTMLGRKSAHPDIHARFRWITLRIYPKNRTVFSRLRIEQDDVDIVVELVRFRFLLNARPSQILPRRDRSRASVRGAALGQGGVNFFVTFSRRGPREIQGHRALDDGTPDRRLTENFARAFDCIPKRFR